jgi:hypothetical protein
LSTHLVLVFLVVSFLLDFPPISYTHSSSPHSCYMPYSSHPPWLDHSNYTWIVTICWSKRKTQETNGNILSQIVARM